MKRRLLPIVATLALLCGVALLAVQIVTDNFTRADSTGLGANWTQGGDGRLDVVSNQAKIGNNNFSIGRYTGAAWTGGNDQYAEAKIIALESGKDMGPMVRNTGTSNATIGGYLLVINEPDAAVSLGGSIACAIYKAVGGSFTKLSASNFSITITASDVMRLEAQGTAIRALQNGVAVGGSNGSVTDAAIASGNPGIYIGSGTTSIWDDFAAGDFSTPGGCPKTFGLLGVGCH